MALVSGLLNEHTQVSLWIGLVGKMLILSFLVMRCMQGQNFTARRMVENPHAPVAELQVLGSGAWTLSKHFFNQHWQHQHE